LGPHERLADFELNTWGVRFRAICRIPFGWRIEAGGNATPEGSLKGQGTHGTTWLNRNGVRELSNLVLVMLHGPVQPTDVRVQNGIVPAAFKGQANIYGPRARTIELPARLGGMDLNGFVKLLRDQSAASAAEYALILAIVGTALAVAAIALGATIGNAIEDASSCIEDRSAC
jgi:pilus assembly protein Flp/PilA